MTKFQAHIKNITLSHSVFALPFAYMGLVLASNGLPSFHDFFWVTVAMVGARSSAMAMDNLVDLKFDKLQERMQKRPLVTGAIKKWEVGLLIIIALLVFIFASMQLNPICIWLTPICLFFLMFYPYMKRISFLCHYFLGIALAMAPAGGYIAVTGNMNLGILFLSLGVCLWIGSFDIIYGSQDYDFDKKNNLHSMATKFGVAKSHKISACIHCISIISFLLTGLCFKLSFIYYIGILIAASILIYQHKQVTPTDFSKLTQAYFMRNGIVGIVIFLCTLISIEL